MKNIISYSLWGDKPIYWKGALFNIELAKKFFPDFICRFYIDDRCDNNLIDSLRQSNTEIVIVDETKRYQGMYWRFEASQDDDVDIFLCRDCDSRLSERERVAVDEWLLSNKDFHIIRDHPYHTVPVLGGTWGCRNGLMKKLNIKSLIEKWRITRTSEIVKIAGHRNHSIEAFGDDQDFLSGIIYPLVKFTTFEHSDFSIKFFNDVNIIKSSRYNYEFIGDVFDENDVRHPEYWKIIKNVLK